MVGTDAPGRDQRITPRELERLDREAYEPYYTFPLGDAPRAEPETYRAIWEEARRIGYPEVDRFEAACGASIDPGWFHELALLTQVVIKESDICYQHGRLLYAALSERIARGDGRALNVLETGTARGFSSLCMAKALDDAGQAGRVVTIDVLPHRTPMYWNCIADRDGPRSRAALLRDYQRRIEDRIVFVQGDARIQLGKVDIPRVHFAFLDGEHTYEAVINEFDYVRRRQEPGDVIFFDDYTPALFPGIVEAVDEACAAHGYETDVVTVSEQRGYAIARKR